MNPRALGCLITCARHAISNDLLAEFCQSNNILTAMWITEPHQNAAYSHTHLVVMSDGVGTYRAKEIAEFFAHYCNIQPLRKLEDVYLSMAYVCKHRLPTVWGMSPHVARVTKEHVLAAFRSYIRRSPKSAKEYLRAQLERMEQAWQPPPPEPAAQPPAQQSQDSELISGSAHDFFPSQ